MWHADCILVVKRLNIDSRPTRDLLGNITSLVTDKVHGDPGDNACAASCYFELDTRSAGGGMATSVVGMTDKVSQ